MSKKIFVAAVAALALGATVHAQTNFQTFYDFGRKHFTTTLEGFHQDNWGNTFFFIDHDYNTRDANNKVYAPSGTYFEIARCLNFWNDTALAPLSLQVEYNGGVYNGYTINSAFLVGLDYFVHNADFSNTFNFKALVKKITYTTQKAPLQFTFVWGMQDIFGVKGLRFSGFADFWWEDHMLFADHNGTIIPTESHTVFISEPQLWYNIGQHFGCDNLNIGGEVELSYDFGTARGFWCRPCAGIKWVF
ncbi:MAG: DUF5020 family protein [Bacteroidales bacterium]|nr:DUF5020 family protein [Bacteroidales bacterium]